MPMITSLRQGALALLLSVLSGCSLMPAAPQPDQAAARWSERQRANLNAWQLKGRIHTADQRASLRWRQTDTQFDLLLRGPFGFGGIRIVGTPDLVEISDGETTVSSAEPLEEIWRRTGLRVPLAALPFWARGLPSPESRARIGRDPAGYIAQIEQGGWVIQLSDYRDAQGLSFPHSVRLEQAPWFLQIEISTWQIH